MLGIIIFLSIATVLELIICHFTLWWVLALIARSLYCLTMLGSRFKIKTIAIIESVGLGGMFIWNMLFAKEHMPWLRLFLFALIGFICVAVMFIDDMLKVTVEYYVDDEEEK